MDSFFLCLPPAHFFPLALLESRIYYYTSFECASLHFMFRIEFLVQTKRLWFAMWMLFLNSLTSWLCLQLQKTNSLAFLRAVVKFHTHAALLISVGIHFHLITSIFHSRSFAFTLSTQTSDINQTMKSIIVQHFKNANSQMPNKRCNRFDFWTQLVYETSDQMNEFMFNRNDFAYQWICSRPQKKWLHSIGAIKCFDSTIDSFFV